MVEFSQTCLGNCNCLLHQSEPMGFAVALKRPVLCCQMAEKDFSLLRLNRPFHSYPNMIREAALVWFCVFIHSQIQIFKYEENYPASNTLSLE